MNFIIKVGNLLCLYEYPLTHQLLIVNCITIDVYILSCHMRDSYPAVQRYKSIKNMQEHDTNDNSSHDGVLHKNSVYPHLELPLNTEYTRCVIQ